MQRNHHKPLKKLTYIEDVMREAYRKSGFKSGKYLDYDRALDAVKMMFDYIAFECKQEEVFAIELPKLGTLYKNVNLLKNTSRDAEGKIDSQIKELQWFTDMNGIASYHNKVPLAWTFHRYINKHFEIHKNTRMMDKINLDVIAATEQLQNNKK